MTLKTPQKADSVRIDKWLWAARFFKSRSIAHDAVTGGKVHLAGQRVKASRAVRVGDSLQISQGYDEKTVIVLGLSEKRLSAPLAALLYEETEESISKRESSRRLRLSQPGHSTSIKPNKKERRQIRNFRDKTHE